LVGKIGLESVGSAEEYGLEGERGRFLPSHWCGIFGPVSGPVGELREGLYSLGFPAKGKFLSLYRGEKGV